MPLNATHLDNSIRDAFREVAGRLHLALITEYRNGTMADVYGLDAEKARQPLVLDDVDARRIVAAAWAVDGVINDAERTALHVLDNMGVLSGEGSSLVQATIQSRALPLAKQKALTCQGGQRELDTAKRFEAHASNLFKESQALSKKALHLELESSRLEASASAKDGGFLCHLSLGFLGCNGGDADRVAATASRRQGAAVASRAYDRQEAAKHFRDMAQSRRITGEPFAEACASD